MTERGNVITYRDESRRPVYYVVLDSLFDSVVIITHSTYIAKHWKQAVDYCNHNKPYTIRENQVPKKH
jgi:hypothetical protein